MSHSTPDYYSLYDLNQMYRQALNDLTVDENGEVFGAEYLHDIQVQREEKILNIGKMIKILQAEEEICDKEIERLKAIKKRYTRKKDWLKLLITGSLPEEEKLSDKHVTIYWRKSTRVDIDLAQLDDIPDEYVTTEVTPIKCDIKKALEQNITIPGAQLTEHRHLQVK